MPGWQTKPLSEVITPMESADPSKRPDETFTYVDVSSVSTDTYSIETPNLVLGRDAPSRARRRIRAGDVVFATIRPTLKRIAVVPDELDGEVCSTGFFVFRPKPTLDARYLFYFLLTDGFMEAMERLQTGASYPAVNDTQVKSQFISFPSLSEQKRIVAILDEAFEGIRIATANAEKNLANARELFASSMHFALDGGWPNKPLTEFLIDGRAVSYGVLKPGPHDPNGVRLLKSQQVRDGWMDLTEEFKITAELDAEYRRTRLNGGEVLLNLVGASIGRSAIAPPEVRGANVSRAIAVIPVRPEWAAWVQYCLQSYVGQRLIGGRTGGAAQPVLNLAEVKTLPIPKPTGDARDAVLVSLDNASASAKRLEEMYSDRADHYRALKQTILSRAFSGQLTATKGLAA